MIKEGNTVTVHYTGKHENGDVFDSSKDKQPISFTVGSGQVIPGFESAVIGMNKGETKTVTIQPKDGYGERMSERVDEVSKDKVPENVQVGAQLQGVDTMGNPMNVVVTQINASTVTVDANHSLAGKVLEFDIEVVDFN